MKMISIYYKSDVVSQRLFTRSNEQDITFNKILLASNKLEKYDDSIVPTDASIFNDV